MKNEKIKEDKSSFPSRVKVRWMTIYQHYDNVDDNKIHPCLSQKCHKVKIFFILQKQAKNIESYIPRDIV